MGGSPTPIPFGELYTALKQGTVDGAENNPPSFHLSGHYEVCKHYSLDEHTATPDVLLVSEALWQELDEAERNALARAASESAELQRRLQTGSADSESIYQLAAHQVMNGEYENALEQLLALMQKDRAYGDDAARNGLLKVFELLGNDPRVGQYRRRMASMLH